MPFDLSTLENRFWKDLDTVDSDVEAALHTKIVDTVVAAAKVILPLVPDGTEVETLLSKFDELAAEAHRVVESAETVISPPVAPEPTADTPVTEAPDEAAPIDPTDQAGPPARPV